MPLRGGAEEASSGWGMWDLEAEASNGWLGRPRRSACLEVGARNGVCLVCESLFLGLPLLASTATGT